MLLFYIFIAVVTGILIVNEVEPYQVVLLAIVWPITLVVLFFTFIFIRVDSYVEGIVND